MTFFLFLQCYCEDPIAWSNSTDLLVASAHVPQQPARSPKDRYWACSNLTWDMPVMFFGRMYRELNFPFFSMLRGYVSIKPPENHHQIPSNPIKSHQTTMKSPSNHYQITIKSHETLPRRSWPATSPSPARSFWPCASGFEKSRRAQGRVKIQGFIIVNNGLIIWINMDYYGLIWIDQWITNG